MQIIKTAGVIFECEDPIEVIRAQTLLTKEPGTIAWLDKHLQPDDVFYDVGANIGCYTLYAAQRLTTGHVYAIEPNIFTARSLMRNVAANHLERHVTVWTVALGRVDPPQPVAFNYTSLRPGASGSQLGHTIGEDGQAFEPVLVEMKLATRLDCLGPLKPSIIKLDVDGNERDIVASMWGTRVRTIQVEMHAKDDADIVAFLEYDHHLHLDHRHHTAQGQKAIDKGADPMSIPHNAVFVR
jgi:FkbM family methyltransferase